MNIILKLTIAPGGGCPCCGGKNAGLTCGAGAWGCPGGGIDIGGWTGGNPVNYKAVNIIIFK